MHVSCKIIYQLMTAADRNEQRTIYVNGSHISQSNPFILFEEREIKDSRFMNQIAYLNDFMASRRSEFSYHKIQSRYKSERIMSIEHDHNKCVEHGVIWPLSLFRLYIVRVCIVHVHIIVMWYSHRKLATCNHVIELSLPFSAAKKINRKRN